jgi:hypothetical protein
LTETAKLSVKSCRGRDGRLDFAFYTIYLDVGVNKTDAMIERSSETECAAAAWNFAASVRSTAHNIGVNKLANEIRCFDK